MSEGPVIDIYTEPLSFSAVSTLSMRAAISLLLTLSSVAYAAESPRYLATLQQRWDASDLVCIGIASAPVQTGFTRTIDGRDRLADNRPNYAVEASPASERFALTQEFEVALVQFDANDVSDIDRILDLLGIREGIAELSKFSQRLPRLIQGDIAVALLLHGQLDSEPLAILLLLDTSAPAGKRANAAEALGQHGTERALRHLQQIASQPATTDDLKSLRLHTLSSLQRLERRLGAR